MNTIEMREKMHRFIETVEEKRMKAIYNLFENEIDEREWDYADDFKKELDARHSYFMNGGVMVTSSEAKEKTGELMKRIKAK